MKSSSREQGRAALSGALEPADRAELRQLWAEYQGVPCVQHSAARRVRFHVACQSSPQIFALPPRQRLQLLGVRMHKAGLQQSCSVCRRVTLARHQRRRAYPVLASNVFLLTCPSWGMPFDRARALRAEMRPRQRAGIVH